MVIRKLKRFQILKEPNKLNISKRQDSSLENLFLMIEIEISLFQILIYLRN